MRKGRKIKDIAADKTGAAADREFMPPVCCNQKEDGTMAEKVTIDDIARAVGKSKSLVSLALANKYGVNEEVRSQIVMTAVRMGYEFKDRQVERSGSRSSSKKKIFICFSRDMLDDTSYWMELICNVERHLQKRGCFSQIYGWDSTQNHEQLVADFYRSGCLGIITFGTGISDEVLGDILQFGRPLVLIDSGNLLPGAIHIKAANYSGMHRAMQYLYDMGHTSICFVGDCGMEETFAERRNGVLRFIERNSGKVKLSLVDDRLTPGLREYVNLEQLRAHLQKRDATAYLCVNDAVAAQVYEQAEALGLRIPEDISVMGFDNANSSKWLRPTLTTCAVDRDRLAELSVEVLLLNLKMEQTDADSLFEGIKVEIPVDIVERESVKCLRADKHKDREILR